AMRIHAARHLAEARRLERAPIAAVHEQREWAGVAAARSEQIDGLPRRGPVFQPDLGAAVLAGFVTIGRALALPALENLRMLGPPGAVVVLDLPIDGHESLPGNSWLASCNHAKRASESPHPEEPGRGQLGMRAEVRAVSA